MADRRCALRIGFLTLVFLIAATPVAASVDLTGSWVVYMEGGTTLNLDFTQSGTTLTASSGGSPVLSGNIDPQTGTFALYTPPTPCAAGMFGTAASDGNSFAGTSQSSAPSCPGGPQTCTCVAVGTPKGVRACRAGGSGDCCGDGVVGPSEACDSGPLPPDACCDTTCHLRTAGDACTSDGNACTSDACDASGTCLHTSANEGGPCADDGNACTVEACQAGVCMHTPGPDSAACAPDLDPCTDDACASGVCTHPPGPDTDGDGICDAQDPCVDGAPIAKPTVVLAVSSPIPNDKLTASGRITLAAGGPPLDPLGTGVHLTLGGSGGAFDVVFPSGAYDPGTRTGWTKDATGRHFKYVAQPAAYPDRAHARLTADTHVPSNVKFSLQLAHTTLSGVTLSNPTLMVSLDPGTTSGRCGQVTFAGPAPAPSCTSKTRGTRTATRCR